MSKALCHGCGEIVDPAAKTRSTYRKHGQGCPKCGHNKLEPMAARKKLTRPNQLVQPMDKEVTQLLSKIANIRRGKK